MNSATHNNVDNQKAGRFKKFGKYSFWVWIGYQTVKGTLTTTFIWVPLIYLHFFS